MKSFFKKMLNNTNAVQEIKEENFSVNKNGTVKVVGGILSVKNPVEDGKHASIIPGTNVKITIDGKEINSKAEVFENSNIEVRFDETIAKREINVVLSENKMEAYITIKYLPQNIYKLKDQKEENNILLEGEVERQIFPPLFKIEEIKAEINKLGIVYGLISENLKKCSEELIINNMLIAKGQEAVDDTDDRIEYNFHVDSDIKKFIEDSTGKVDFKNIGAIDSVKKDDIIAIKVNGAEGKDGIDVKGNVKKHNIGKKIKFKVSQGCTIKDENSVVAAVDGKPCIKGNTFFVYQVHEVSKDVDLKTGNIKFAGDIIIKGDIKEGMKVEAENSVQVFQNVERADIKAKGDVTVNGNIIASKVVGGGEDVNKLNEMEILEELKKYFGEFISTIEEVKKFNLLGYDTADGEIIKVLLEGKFKKISKLSFEYIKQVASEGNFETLSRDEIMFLIKNKLVGLAPLSIKHYSELNVLGSAIQNKLESLKHTLNLPVNVKISYCQDSLIKSSGDVFIVGKGVYISNIEAQKSIYFSGQNGILRGGIVKAQDEIKCKIVGSTGGVATKLIVGEKGSIFADIAYENTAFVVGTRELNLDSPSKNIKVYLDDNGELKIDKLKL